MEIACLILIIIVAMFAGPKICNYFELGLGGILTCMIIIQICAALLFYMITGTEPGGL